MNCVKALAESREPNSIPSIYTYFTDNESPASNPQDSIPVIDFSLLTSSDPDLRSQVIHELDNACKDWGFFQVINHGVPDALMKMVIEKTNEFFNLTNEEKNCYEEKEVFDMIKYGTSISTKNDKVLYWRDFLKVVVHPEVHSPNKPIGLSEVVCEYSKRTRKVASELLRGVSTSLGLDQSHLEKALKLECGLDICISNLYPPCPEPELAIGLPPHSDFGLLTLLINNGVGGLQIKHNGKWVNVNDTLTNSFLVNIGDQLEVFSNGRYKSVEHRVIVNNLEARRSVGVFYGPALDAMVMPACELVDEEQCPAAFVPMKYEKYLELQHDYQIVGKTCLDRVRV